MGHSSVLVITTQPTMQALDAAQITAQQQTNWDRHADTYTEVVIRKDENDAATIQVTSAITDHKELACLLASGKQVAFTLQERHIVASECMRL